MNLKLYFVFNFFFSYIFELCDFIIFFKYFFKFQYSSFIIIIKVIITFQTEYQLVLLKKYKDYIIQYYMYIYHVNFHSFNFYLISSIYLVILTFLINMCIIKKLFTYIIVDKVLRF
jgi:hypothetical protein